MVPRLMSPLSAQAVDATLTFHFDRPGMEVPSYLFIVHENGSGTYQAVAAEAAPVSVSQARPLALTAAKTAKLFEQARSAELSRRSCASKAKNIANTGAKVLTYSGPGGDGTCSFNYTENKAVITLTQSFQAMENTLEIGNHLARLHRFDRLGLDQEMQRLVEAVQSGQAIEVSLIAPMLRALKDDPEVIERVRVRASKLLEMGTLNQ